MKKRNNHKYYLIILLVLFISVGFAYLSSTLNITGLTNITGNSWNIYFDNIQYVRGQDFEVTAPSTTGTTTTSVSYQVFLPSPGDVYKFNIDVVNSGSIDAMVKVVTDTELTSTQKQYASYYVTYSDGINCDDYQLLPKNSRDTLSVMVAYNKDIDEANIPTTDQSITVKFHIEYEQATSKATSRKHITVVNRQTEGQLSIGDEIALGDEQFYVTSTNDEKTVLLAKYNLYVGSVFDRTTNPKQLIKTLTEADEGYGRQSSTALANVNTNTNVATVSYSNNNYWVENGQIKSKYGTSYPVDTYDETYSSPPGTGYSIAYYVKNYVDYLREQDLLVQKGRLLTYSEVNNFGCTFTGDFAINCTNNNYNFILNTSYWLGSSSSNTRAMRMYYNGILNDNGIGSSDDYGVRPVNEIPALDI